MFGIKAYELALRKKGISAPVMEAALKLHNIYMESDFSSEDDALDAVETEVHPGQNDTGDTDLTQLIDENPKREEETENEPSGEPAPHVQIFDIAGPYKDKNHTCANCGISTKDTSRYDAYKDGNDTHYTGDICDRCLTDLTIAQGEQSDKFDTIFNTLTRNGRPHKAAESSKSSSELMEKAGLPEGFSDDTITSANPNDSSASTILTKRDTSDDGSSGTGDAIRLSTTSQANRTKRDMEMYKKYFAKNGESVIPNMVFNKHEFFERMQTAINTGDTGEFEKCKRILSMCAEVPTTMDPIEKNTCMNLILDTVDNDDGDAYRKFQAHIRNANLNTDRARKQKWDSDLASRRRPIDGNASQVNDTGIDLGSAKEAHYPLTMAIQGGDTGDIDDKSGALAEQKIKTIGDPKYFNTGYDTIAKATDRQNIIDKKMEKMAHGTGGFLNPMSPETYNPTLAAKIAKHAPADSPWGRELIDELKNKILPSASPAQRLDFIKDLPDTDRLDVLGELAEDPTTAPTIDEYLGSNTTMSAGNIIKLARIGLIDGELNNPENPQAQLVKIAINLHSGNPDRQEIIRTISEMSDKNVVSMFSLLTPDAVQKFIGCNAVDSQEIVDSMADPNMTDEDKKDLIIENASPYKQREINRRASANKSIIDKKVKEAKNRAIDAYRASLKGQIESGAFREELPSDMSEEEKDACVSLASSYAESGDPGTRRKLVQHIHGRR